MSAKPKVYVVLRRSGAPMLFRSANPGQVSTAHHPGPYLLILAAIHEESGQSGQDYDPPEKLLLNGKEVPLKTSLGSAAYAYDQDMREAKSYAIRAVNNLHIPDALMEERPGFNPPGIDRWKVEKVKP